MSGGFSVPFIALSVGVPANYGAPIFAVMAFLSAWYAGFAMWRIQKQRADELKEQLTPKLRIDTVVTEDCEAVSATSTAPILTVRIKIETLTGANVADCKTVVNEIWKRSSQTGKFVPVWTKPSPWFQVNGLVIAHPGMPAWHDLLWAHETSNTLTPAKFVGWPYKLIGALQDTGTYRFEVAVAAPSVPTATAVIEVEWTGQWNELTAKLVDSLCP